MKLISSGHLSKRGDGWLRPRLWGGLKPEDGVHSSTCWPPGSTNVEYFSEFRPNKGGFLKVTTFFRLCPPGYPLNNTTTTKNKDINIQFQQSNHCSYKKLTWSFPFLNTTNIQFFPWLEGKAILAPKISSQSPLSPETLSYVTFFRKSVWKLVFKCKKKSVHSLSVDLTWNILCSSGLLRPHVKMLCGVLYVRQKNIQNWNWPAGPWDSFQPSPWAPVKQVIIVIENLSGETLQNWDL